MKEPTTQTVQNDRRKQEEGVLEKYALRWAVLAAWKTEIVKRGVSVPPDVMSDLATARVKISSGCFSPCEVGCDLRKIEGTLTAVDASSAGEQTDKWLGLLGRAMADKVEPDELLSVPAIRIQFNDCRSRGCACGS
jgi:hypothetical protein